MTGRGRLGPGDRVWVDGTLLTVVGVAGPAVRLADVEGSVSAVLLAVLQASPGFAVVGAGTPVGGAGDRAAGGVPAAAAAPP